MCRSRQSPKSARGGFPIRKGEDDLVKALNDALAKLQKDGTLKNCLSSTLERTFR